MTRYPRDLDWSDYERDGALAEEDALDRARAVERGELPSGSVILKVTGPRSLSSPGEEPAGPYEVEHRPKAFLHGRPGWVVVHGSTRAYAGGPFEAVESATSAAERLNEAAR